jgi:hypothetical protein
VVFAQEISASRTLISFETIRAAGDGNLAFSEAQAFLDSFAISQ